MSNIQYQRILNEMMQKIEKGEWGISEKLPTINKTAMMYKVGTSTIREVYKSLESKGYINIQQGRGSFVKNRKPLKTSSIERDSFIKLLKLTELRIMIEPPFAAEAAINAYNHEIDQIVELTKDMEEVAKENKPTYELDLQFHKSIVEATHNEYAVNIYESLQHELRFMHSFAKKKEMVEKAIHYHQMITDSIITRNPTNAKMYMETHLMLKNSEIMMYESTEHNIHNFKGVE